MSEKFVYRVTVRCHHCKEVKQREVRYTAFTSALIEKRVGCRDCGNTGNRKGPIMFFFRDLGRSDDDGNQHADVIVKRIA